MKNKLTNQQINIVKEELLYDGFMQLKKMTFDHLKYQGGFENGVQRELLIRGKAVGVLLYDPIQQLFVMVEQVRIGALEDPLSPWVLEIVAGLVEPNEQDDEVAHREAVEEAGAKIKKLIPIQEYWASPGGSDERIALFLALVDANTVSEFAGLDSEHEDIKVVKLSRDEALQKLRGGHINNSMALIALQWFFLNQAQLDFKDF